MNDWKNQTIYKLIINNSGDQIITLANKHFYFISNHLIFREDERTKIKTMNEWMKEILLHMADLVKIKWDTWSNEKYGHT